MALFKILKGKSANLPSNKVNGYCYVTIDEHKLYVDYTKDDGTLDRFALNAVSADQWKTARNLNGMVVNGTSNVVNYGTCSTAAATAAKVVSCSNFALITGAEITVKFTTTNIVAKPTLNVNNTGAKAIYYRGSAISAGYLAANRTYTFRYNGSQYDLVGDIDTNTTYSAGTGLTLSGTKFNHSNSITAGTAKGDDSKTLGFGSTFTIPTVTYDAQGHITGKGTTTMTMPANPNTDTKVKQTVTTSNATYPLLLAPSGQTATSTTTSYFDSGVTLNPSTNTIAANISGTAATATKATQDGNGNIISSTYLPLSAGQDKKLTGPLGLTENVNYGTSLPDNSFNGQLFFVEEEDTPSLPTGGTAGQVLVKNSSIDGDAGWATDIVGNAATATKLKTARTIQTNLASTTSASFNGSANITPGVTGTLGVGNGGTGSTTKKGAWSNLIPYYEAPWSTIAEDTGNNWASLGNSSVTWWPENANGIYNKPSSWGLAFTISAGPSGSLEMHQLWFSQANGSIYHRGGNGATASSMEANSWAKLWQTGDSVTGAVWNDYAEYRESDCGEFGYVLTEKGDDTLTKTAERLQPFAGVSSDTWGFCQGETERAKTPIAVAGRVLVYPYQDRNNYKPGDCVCAAPGGTVDIMTREEVREWPDRIVGTVSCVPDYEEWGGGESADRDPVKVNGRIWIKVV